MEFDQETKLEEALCNAKALYKLLSQHMFSGNEQDAESIGYAVARLGEYIHAAHDAFLGRDAKEGSK